MKSYAFLYWAYNVIWFVLAGYLLFLMLRLRRLDGRLTRLEREIERGTNELPR